MRMSAGYRRLLSKSLLEAHARFLDVIDSESHKIELFHWTAHRFLKRNP